MSLADVLTRAPDESDDFAAACVDYAIIMSGSSAETTSGVPAGASLRQNLRLS